MKRPAEALQAFEISEKHDPNRFRGLYGAGKAAALAGDQAKAKSYYEKLLALAKTPILGGWSLRRRKCFCRRSKAILDYGLPILDWANL
jgi:tetratricopeptide (TPR) repeat protein